VELEAALQQAQAERNFQTATVAEHVATLQLRQADIGRLEEQLAEARDALAATRASLEESAAKVETLSDGKRAVEVEYRSYKEHHGTSNAQQMEAITELKLTVDKLSQQVESKQVELGAKEGNIGQQQEYIHDLLRKLDGAESARRELHNTVQTLKGNIRVFCRIRPAAAGSEAALLVPEANKLSLQHAGEAYPFGFDKVFGGDTSQEAIFHEVDGLVQSALDGYKVCIFAYGQTGSGKTFTMQGTKDPANWGMIPRALSKILETSKSMRSDGWTWTLQATFLEVYNENLRDLLSDDAASPSLGIVHDEAWGTVVTNIVRVEVTSMEEVTMLMAKAAKHRAVGHTDMNATSSRSHSVFALYLTGVNSQLGTELHGALHLVDLAGSERLDKSGATGDRLRETQNINKSLSSLADVFMAKAERRPHVPFRNSKLTYLMEPCLSGQGKTLMMVNVAPEGSNSHETLCSLRFASQVNQCDTGGKPKRTAKATAGGSANASSKQLLATSGPATGKQPARPHTANPTVPSKRIR